MIALVGSPGTGKTRFFQHATRMLNPDIHFRPSKSWLIAPCYSSPHIWLMDTGTDPYPCKNIKALLLFDGNWVIPPELEGIPVITWSGDDAETLERIQKMFALNNR